MVNLHKIALLQLVSTRNFGYLRDVSNSDLFDGQSKVPEKTVMPTVLHHSTNMM